MKCVFQILPCTAARKEAANARARQKRRENIDLELTPESFKSHDELKAYVTDLILSISKRFRENLIVSSPKKYRFLRALLQYHPDAERKKVAHINNIHIRKSPYGKKPVSIYMFYWSYDKGFTVYKYV